MWSARFLRTLGLLIIMLCLTSCAAISHERSFTPNQTGRSEETAEAIHRQYLTALKKNDRATVLQLTADTDDEDGIVTRRLAALQYEMNPVNQVTGGALSGIEVLHVVNEGSAIRGVSRWQYAHTSICHVALLVEHARSGWQVTDWRDLPTCTN